MKRLLTLFVVLLGIVANRMDAQDVSATLKVFQLNTWMNGSRVEGGKEGLIAIIEQLHPDVVLLCELASNETSLTYYLQKELEDKGQKWYIDGLQKGCGILSKYELLDIQEDTVLKSRPFVKAHIVVNGSKIAVYSAHLDHRFYAPYLSRGYSGSKWGEKITPVTDAKLILEDNRKSTRNEGIDAFIAYAAKEIESGNAVILGGDFNEPSHLDWQADTKNMFGHNGVVVNWDVSPANCKKPVIPTLTGECIPIPLLTQRLHGLPAIHHLNCKTSSSVRMRTRETA
ncbi:MAG: endonuclease/exonuclease/phosphatase family protein [Tannerella sp.]|nr:endonuclease/exonuclease/phosphatase family protein [Tannerella sp.]